MAATVAQKYKAVPGNEYIAIFDFTGDSSYPTGGYAVTPQTFGLNSAIRAIIGGPQNVSTTLYDVVYNPTTSKIQFFTAAGAEVTNTTDVSAYTRRLVIFGI